MAKKYIEEIPEEAKPFFSINFFMAELHEIKRHSEHKRFMENKKKDVSTDLGDYNLDTYSFFKKTSSVLDEDACKNLKDLENEG